MKTYCDNCGYIKNDVEEVDENFFLCRDCQNSIAVQGIFSALLVLIVIVFFFTVIFIK